MSRLTAGDRGAKMAIIWRLFVAVVFSLFLAAAPAVAQPRPNPDCRDDNGVNRCAEAQQGRVRALFGVRSIEEYQAAGDQVRRVFYVDGYGRDLILIAFVRAPGRDPTLWVHFPRREGEPATEPLQAAVPRLDWEDVLFRSALFDRDLVPRQPPPNTIPICMHNWGYTVEATDPARSQHEPATVRRATEHGCGASLVRFFAVEAQKAALPLLPYCARLDPGQHRNPAAQLAACRTLRGDRMAAAEALNRAGAFPQVDGPGDVVLIADRFAQGAVVDWNGERNQGDSSAALFWATKVGEAGHANFFYDSVEGLSGTRVRLTGFLSRSVEEPGSDRSTIHRARVEQIWAVTPIQEFQVERATVGPWEAAPQR